MVQLFIPPCRQTLAYVGCTQWVGMQYVNILLYYQMQT